MARLPTDHDHGNQTQGLAPRPRLRNGMMAAQVASKVHGAVIHGHSRASNRSRWCLIPAVPAFCPISSFQISRALGSFIKTGSGQLRARATKSSMPQPLSNARSPIFRRREQAR